VEHVEGFLAWRELQKRRLAIYDQPVQQGGMSSDIHELRIS